MADNKTADPGSGGATFATDEIGGVDWPFAKMAWGPRDTANEVDDVDGKRLPVAEANTIDANNSTTSVLGGGAVFTGTGTDVSNHAVVSVMLDASHDSAASGMTFQVSTDDTNWDDVYAFTYTAADGARRFQFPVTGQYFRFVYTNGGTLQTHFRAQTILHKKDIGTSIHRLEDDVDPDRSAIIVKAGLIAQVNGSGDFVPIQANAGGILKIGGSVELDAGSNSIGTLGANDGVDIGDVTINNAAGAAAVNIQDGGNAITVDGTVTADAGTNLNTSALALETGGNLATVAGAVAGTEMQVDVVAALPAGTNAIGKLAANTGVDIGDVDVTSIAAGANLVGDVGISGARTSGGTTLYKNIDVDQTEDQVKGTAGQVYWIHAINLKATPLFLKFYNVAAASVTVGTTVPDLTFPVPSQGDTNGAGFNIAIPNGIEFDTAITIAATTGVADNDSGAPGANECIVNLGYA